MAVPAPAQSARDIRAQQLAIRLSLGVGVLMFLGKSFAYYLTGSAAIFSDAAESVVHVAAVGFAAFSLWLSLKPADESHPYGHEKINFFSAGFEGAMIVIAALYILFAAISKWLAGLHLERLGEGTLILSGAALINGVLGWYLIWLGKRQGSLILEANGRHVLTDFYTSVGVIGGLCLTLLTGWLPFDPILAILVALNILWSGGQLMRQAFGGLMDERDSQVDSAVRAVLEQVVPGEVVEYHGLRHRQMGNSVFIDVHLLFGEDAPLRLAHATATRLEEQIAAALRPQQAVVTAHLECVEGHGDHHPPLVGGTSREMVLSISEDDRQG
ncbi:MAG: cation transporter [Candidatus Latescibacteria bacterium]|nr:cation transporter [Candidatus Latescibacterota bacterium]